jgi:hypothetical protein
MHIFIVAQSRFWHFHLHFHRWISVALFRPLQCGNSLSHFIRPRHQVIATSELAAKNEIVLLTVTDISPSNK